MCHHRRRGFCNTPQPYGAYNSPQPYGAYNPPQPYGAYNPPQPYGFHNRRGCHSRRHGGPISALFALAVPLITGNSQQQQQQQQPQMQQRSINREFNDERPQNADYYQNSSRTNLAPQDSGYTTTTTTREVPIAAPDSMAAPAAVRVTQEYSAPRDAPPAYEESPSSREAVPTLEKSLEGMTISPSSTPAPAPAPPSGPTTTTTIPRDLPSSAPRTAPAYTPLSATYTQQEEGQRQQGEEGGSYMPRQQQQQQQQLPLLDPNSRWAAKLQRKEEKLRAKLEKKAEKLARKEKMY